MGRAVFFIIGATVVTLHVFSSVHAQTPPPPAAPSAPQRWIKTSDRASDFFGKWSGKWKDIYGLRITIGPDPKGAPGKCSVLYEYQPHRDSPFEKEQAEGRLDGGALVIGKITLFLLEESDRLLVHGNYEHRSMITEVVRDKTR